MKLLKLDSGRGARKQLAKELGYTGALDMTPKHRVKAKLREDRQSATRPN